MTGNDVLAVAKKEIGTKEQPTNSNKVKYNTWYYGREVSGTAYPWCMAFVQWCYAQAGAKLPCVTASCGALLAWYKKNQPECVVKDPQPGDIIIFDFPGGAATDHTGLFERMDGKNVVSIDGNTGTGNDANGGAVMRRARPSSNVKAYIRPREITQAATADEAVDKLYKLGVLNSPDVWRTLVQAGSVRYGLRASTVRNGVSALVKAGVIDSPDYWARTAETMPNVGELLKALGGAAAVS